MTVTLVITGALTVLIVVLGITWRTIRSQRQLLADVRPEHVDTVTGLPDRDDLVERTSHGRSLPGLQADDLAMIVIGIADLGSINESLGHSAGNQVLTEAAHRLREQSRSGEYLARAGEARFALLLAPPTTLYGASRAANRLTACLADPFDIDGLPVQIAIHTGVAVGSDPAQVLDDAEFALTRAHQTGQSAPMLYDPDERAEAKVTFHRAQYLRSAIERQEFRIDYQPIHSLETGGLTSVEALLRWQNTRLGAVAPDSFISIAENSGVIVEVGSWVLGRACADLREIAGDDRGLAVSVNVSVPQLWSPDFVETVERALSEAGIEPQRLQIEVVESMFAEPDEVVESLVRVRELGVRVALDDVGSGYSALGQLTNLPIDVIKIDKTLLPRHIVENSAGQQVFTGVASLGRSLGLGVISEGIETVAQQRFARAAGCTHEQGYLRSKPLALAEVVAYGLQHRTEATTD